jgi:hypothetical protein
MVAGRVVRVLTNINFPAWTVAVADDLDAVHLKISAARSAGEMLAFRTSEYSPRRVFVNPDVVVAIRESEPDVNIHLWELL